LRVTTIAYITISAMLRKATVKIRVAIRTSISELPRSSEGFPILAFEPFGAFMLHTISQ